MTDNRIHDTNNHDKNSNDAGYPSITIKNFKSYKNATLPLAPLTLLIGANASGKSNAIEALRFLSWVAGGERLTTLKNRVNDSDKVVRGKPQDMFAKTSGFLSLNVTTSKNLSYEAVFGQQHNHLFFKNEFFYIKDEIIHYKFLNSFPVGTNIIKNTGINENNIPNSSQFTIQDEISQPSYSLIMSSSPIHNFFVDNSLTSRRDFFDLFFNPWESSSLGITSLRSYDRYLLTKNKPTKELISSSTEISNLSLLQDYASNVIENSNFKKNSINQIFNLLNNMRFFDFIPKLMNKESIQDTNLRPDGSNLAGVMYQICQDNPDNKTKVLTIIQSLPEQHISDIVFYPDRRGRVEFALVESYGNADNPQSNECPMDLLSDGTLKALAIATALLSVPEGATLLIEEIDNSIHPSRANEMLSLMRHIATERNLKLLLSTHNPALMDALPDQALADVVFCYRDPSEGDSRLTRLGDLEDYVGLTVQGSLGDLVTKGLVERFVKHPTTREQRKQKALQWLDSMWEDD